MKNYLFPFSFLLLSLGIQAEKPQWGIPDTISHYPIGPGAVYTHIEFTQKPIQLHQITLDLNNEYNAVEVYPSNGRLRMPHGRQRHRSVRVTLMKDTGRFSG